jgi:hypothetical protein
MILVAILMCVSFPLVAYEIFLRFVSPSQTEAQNFFDAIPKQTKESYQLSIYGIRGKYVAQALFTADLLGDEINYENLDRLDDKILFTLDRDYKGAPLKFAFTVSNDMNRYAQWPLGTPRIIIAVGEQIGPKEALSLFSRIESRLKEKFRTKELIIDPARLSLLMERKYRPALAIFCVLDIAALIYFWKYYYAI